MKSRTALGSIALAGLVLAGTTAVPAHADLVTHCVGTGGSVTVPGDLVVPKGSSCILNGTTVQGDVTVRADADLITTGAHLAGDVSVRENSYLDTHDTDIDGTVVSHGGYGVYLDTSTVGGAVRGQAPSDDSVHPFLFLVDTEVGKQVRSESGELLIQGSQVHRRVTGAGTMYTDVLNSTLLRGLTVTGNTLGSQVCSSEVLGDATYQGNYQVQLGDGDLVAPCEKVNYFGGDVTISDTTGGVVLNGNIILGDLTGTGNQPAPVGDSNRVRGNLGGQFVDMAQATQAVPQARALVEKRPAERVDSTKARAEQRRQDAVAAAESAGAANF